MIYKLGRLQAREDKRTIKLATILKALPAYPAAFDVDSQYPKLTDRNMFKNDVYSDCVIAGRAHQTLRFEDYEQKLQIPISDNDVEDEYKKETGGGPGWEDAGLDMLTSLNQWRQGWTAAGKTYSIYAYTKVDATNQNEVMAACYLFNGLYIGLRLPISAQNQEVWDVATGPNSLPDSWGGHCVYVVAYDDEGLTCLTWGERKKMTWAFFQTYCDQAFAVIDQKDNWVTNSPVDITTLSNILTEITGEPVPPPVPVPPVPVKKNIWQLIIEFIIKIFGGKK